MATSAVMGAYSSSSSMKRFKCINVKTSLPGTPFANAKLLKLFLTVSQNVGTTPGGQSGRSLWSKDGRKGQRHSLETSFHSLSKHENALGAVMNVF